MKTNERNSMTRYLVTGGAGFIGSHLVEALVRRSYQVRVLDNFCAGNRDNLATVQDDIECIVGDVRDPVICRRAMQGVDRVVHLAALHEVARSVEYPMETHEVNVTGTLNLLLAARSAGVEKFVFASSSAVYGDNLAPRSEDMQLPATSSLYAASKLAGEYYCRTFSTLYALETVCLRFFNVYGPRQDAASPYAAVIPKFLSLVHAGTAPSIYGDGEQSRDFTFIADCVAATVTASERDGLSGKIFNVGTGRRTTVNELYALIQRMLRTDLTPRCAPPQPGDVAHDQADIQRARKWLSYRSRYDLRRGLQETVQRMPIPARPISATADASAMPLLYAHEGNP